jgi:hypothetical protein
MTEIIDMQKLILLLPGEQCTINWFDGGGGLVTNDGEKYILEYSNQYGGDIEYVGDFSKEQFDEIISIAYSWT